MGSKARVRNTGTLGSPDELRCSMLRKVSSNPRYDSEMNNVNTRPLRMVNKYYLQWQRSRGTVRHLEDAVAYTLNVGFGQR